MKIKGNIEDIFPLSPMQEGLLFHSLYDKSSSAYFQQISYRIKGKLYPSLIQLSLEMLFERHAILRTAFVSEGVERPLQVVLKDRKASFEFIDLTFNTESENKDIFIEDFKQGDRERSFDLLKNPLLRVSVIQVTSEESILIWSYHHIIMDGWCIGILNKEFQEIYYKLYKKEEVKLPAVKSYSAFIKWLQKQDIDHARSYWQDYLKNYDSASLLFGKNESKKSTRQPYQNKNYILKLDNSRTEKLIEIAGKYQITLSSLILSLWGVLINKYRNAKDSIMGLVVSGRPSEIEEVDSIVGLFINTIPFRITYEKGAQFNDVLIKTQTDFLSLAKYDYYPLSEIQSESRLKPNTIDHLIIFENFPIQEKIKELNEFTNLLREESFEVSDIEIFEQTTYDLNLNVILSDFIIIRFDYNQVVYEKDIIAEIGERLLYLVDQVIKTPEIKVEDLSIFIEKDKELYKKFNSTLKTVGLDKTTLQLIQERTLQFPDKIAIEHNRYTITYKSLWEGSNRQANHIKKQYLIEKGDLIGILMNRNPQMIESILALWKIGAVYVPIDPSLPLSRIATIVNDAKLKLIIANRDTENKYHFNKLLDIQTEIFYNDKDILLKESAENLPQCVIPSDPAYIIYTSGSTGTPKGAIIEHAGMLNHIYAKIEEMSISHDSTIAQNASQSFDISIWQFFTAIVCGGKTIIYGNDVITDTLKFIREIIQDNITILQVVPSYLSVMLDVLEEQSVEELPFDFLVVTGEELKKSLVKRFFEKFPYIPVINAYGPTEASDDITHYRMNNEPSNELIPIGKALRNFKIYITDEQMRLCPIGVRGEICVAGVGVGRGYLNNGSKTLESFLTDLFMPDSNDRLYKTGDIGRYLHDGNIEFYGRKDYQLKIRGYRIELGEIEYKLLAIKGIKDAIVVDFEQNHEKFLAAFIIPENGSKIEMDQLRNELEKELPDYMVPSKIVAIDKMPLTNNGKIDRASLKDKAKEFQTVIVKEERLKNETELRLETIWCEVLNKKNVGLNENFFKIGGHSLKAMLLVSRIHKHLKVKIELKEIFSNPTIQSLSSIIQTSLQSNYEVIEPVKGINVFNLSHGQERIWLLSQIPETSIAYNIPLVFSITGDFKLEIFREAFLALVARHESLRTVFINTDGTLKQKVLHVNELNFVLDYIDKRDLPNEDEFIKQLSLLEAGKSFDLERGPLTRIKVVRSEENKFILMITIHHIIADGWSIEIFIKELMTIYNTFCKGKINTLSPLKLQYRDFVAWEEKHLGKELFNEHRNYWLKLFKGEIPRLEIPTSHPRPPKRRHKGEQITSCLDNKLTQQLRTVCNQEGVSLYMILLASVKVLLYKYTGQRDIIIGSPIAGRSHTDFENQIGFFVNTLPIRSYISKGETFKLYLLKIKEIVTETFEHQAYPFDILINDLNIKRDLSRTPLFDVMMVLQNQEFLSSEYSSTEELTIASVDFDSGTSKFDLLITFSEAANKININFQYDVDLFNSEYIEQILKHYSNIVSLLVSDPSISIDALDYVPEEEKQKIIYSFNNYAERFPEKNIINLFEEQVKSTPSHIALIFREQELTYSLLNEKVNELAHCLLDNYEVNVNDRVVVMLDRSEYAVICLLAIIKVGACYVPIDRKMPSNRLNFILNDADPKLIVLEKEIIQELSKFEFLLIDKASFQKYSKENPQISIREDDDSYIIYTSGSTGSPKGVVQTHKTLSNLINWEKKYSGIEPSSRILQYASFYFDVSLQDVFFCLLTGGTLYVVEDSLRHNFSLLINYIIEYEVEVLSFPFSVLSNLFQFMEIDKVNKHHIKHIISSGEQLLIGSNLEHFMKKFPYVKLHNHYGPSETHVVTAFTGSMSSSIPKRPPIGIPISNTSIFIVDENKNIVPINVPGEIYIGGANLFKSYLNNSALTETKLTYSTYFQEKIYKSGDIGRWLPSGSIEYLGRKDNQVKIQGFRVELNEIENIILKYNSINDVFVTVRSTQNNEILLAYVTGREKIESSDLKQYLKEFLPDYMIPGLIIQLKELPLNSNGKIDFKALPDIELNLENNVNVEPRTEAEEKIKNIWAELFNNNRISVESNFFEIGGNSIKAIQAISRIHKLLNVKLSLSDFFLNSTIESLARIIDKNQKERFDHIEPVDIEEHYEASHSQKRLWIYDSLKGNKIAHNLGCIYKMEGLDKAIFEKAYSSSINRHESLRTYFTIIDGELYQKIRNFDSSIFRVEHISLLQNIDPENYIKEIASADISKAFNIEEEPLIRAKLLQIGEQNYVLILTIHHIISDAWSISILINDLITLYNDFLKGDDISLPQLKIHYKDYSYWLNNKLKGDNLEALKKYWLEQFSDDFSPFALPTDFDRVNATISRSAYVDFKLSSELSNKLKLLSDENEVSLFMTLISILKLVLYRFTWKKDITIGFPVSGREHLDLENQIGYYINTLPLRTKIDICDDFIAFLLKVKKTTLKAYEHQLYPIAEIVNDLNLNYNWENSSLFQTGFSWQNIADNIMTEEKELTGVRVKPMEMKELVSVNDLWFYGFEAYDSIALKIQYNSELFKESSIDRMKTYFNRICEEVVLNQTMSINDLCKLLLDESDKDFLNDYHEYVNKKIDETF